MLSFWFGLDFVNPSCGPNRSKNAVRNGSWGIRACRCVFIAMIVLDMPPWNFSADSNVAFKKSCCTCVVNVRFQQRFRCRSFVPWCHCRKAIILPHCNPCCTHWNTCIDIYIYILVFRQVVVRSVHALTSTQFLGQLTGLHSYCMKVSLSAHVWTRTWMPHEPIWAQVC